MPNDRPCPYCHGIGTAPGDGRTPCGFCAGPIRCQLTNRLGPVKMRGGTRFVPCRSTAEVRLERRGEFIVACQFHATQARSAGWTEDPR